MLGRSKGPATGEAASQGLRFVVYCGLCYWRHSLGAVKMTSVLRRFQKR